MLNKKTLKKITIQSMILKKKMMKLLIKLNQVKTLINCLMRFLKICRLTIIKMVMVIGLKMKHLI